MKALNVAKETPGMIVSLQEDSAPVVIIGAGPAGLTAAHELHRNQRHALILEAGSMVGGLSRTEEYKGYLFDIGGHRFFTKVKLIEDFWHEILGKDFLSRPRLSRIYYRGKFYQYPLEPWNALENLGLLEAALCFFSYLKITAAPVRPEETFDAWVTNRFGRRLFEIFFKSYTEKVWGMPCNQIQADWAAQRIQGLNMWSMIANHLLPKGRRNGNKNGVIKTLIHEFHYPRFGPGMMWEKCQDLLEAAGSRVRLNTPVTRIAWREGQVTHVEAAGSRFAVDHVISTMPIRELVECLDPPPPQAVRQAAQRLRYRDFLTLALIIRQKDLFPDNWIYVHEPGVQVARIQNFKNWSPEMVPDPGMTCLGLEYFCFENDGLWSMKDSDLLELGRKELASLRLVRPEDVVDGKVLRIPKAYPVYDGEYRQCLAVIREFAATLPNLQLIGRNGMHRYNNQDHSMLTGILAARNILGARYDLWQVNVDSEYQEQGAELTEEDFDRLESTQPYIPATLAQGR